MAYIHLPPSWRIPEREATPESVYWNRRTFLKALGLGGIAATTGLATLAGTETGHAQMLDAAVAKALALVPDDVKKLFPVKRNPAYKVGTAMTDEVIATAYNNYYEFTTKKNLVWKYAEDFPSRPWTIEIAGLVDNPKTYDADDLIRSFPMEERVYRFRCVERWAMVVPWTGIPFREIVKAVQPKSEATHVRFVSFLRPQDAPEQAKPGNNWPWPYYEGLRMDEAMNELTMLVTGIYGKPLPNQNGAPLRMIVPWKYGYKNPKGIVRIEFVNEQPPTFWSDLYPMEYPFESNVNPNVPHPRWSQAQEKLIGTGEPRKTEIYNGYGEQVGNLYA